MYKHIIWDFDGTLFDTYPVMASIFKELLEERGNNEPLEEIINQMKVSMSHALKYYEAKYQIDHDFIEKYKMKRKNIEVGISKPFAGVEEICKYIYDSNKHNYLYTHRGESSIQLLKKFGLDKYFTDFITSENGFKRKPSPDAILYLVEKHSFDPSQAIMIGDRDLDILSAKNAGVDGCFFTEGKVNSEISDYTIDDLQKLYSIIDDK
ncbi:HAD-IA family hydrolase [Aquibacillus kalidii]|uniref:HAD-IA family hydrolase n=1 Tax=Aquibacillus kalidii TaxID=2762597 RepID=UPI0016495BE6|nr:HAD-IA family hydrolase [Aquibacillus kalidii]